MFHIPESKFWVLSESVPKVSALQYFVGRENCILLGTKNGELFSYNIRK